MCTFVFFVSIELFTQLPLPLYFSRHLPIPICSISPISLPSSTLLSQSLEYKSLLPSPLSSRALSEGNFGRVPLRLFCLAPLFPGSICPTALLFPYLSPQAICMPPFSTDSLNTSIQHPQSHKIEK